MHKGKSLAHTRAELARAARALVLGVLATEGGRVPLPPRAPPFLHAARCPRDVLPIPRADARGFLPPARSGNPCAPSSGLCDWAAQSLSYLLGTLTRCARSGYLAVVAVVAVGARLVWWCPRCRSILRPVSPLIFCALPLAHMFAGCLVAVVALRWFGLAPSPAQGCGRWPQRPCGARVRAVALRGSLRSPRRFLSDICGLPPIFCACGAVALALKYRWEPSSDIDCINPPALNNNK